MFTNTNYGLDTPTIGGFSSPGYGGVEVPSVDEETGNATPTNSGGGENNGGFDWSSVFGLGSSIAENSGQIASIFSPKYRQDQIELAKQQGMFSSNPPIFGKEASPEDKKEKRNLIALIVIALVVILILVFLLKKPKK